MSSTPNRQTDLKYVLVTGATGFIGAKLVRLLSINGYKVRAYSRKPYREVSDPCVDKNDWVTGTLEAKDRLIRACHGIDVVFHIAGLAHSSFQDKGELSRVNSSGTYNVFSAAGLAGVKKFVYFSSMLASEPHTSAYAASKKSAEQILLYHSKDQSDPMLVILRPANVYGPGMRGNISTYIRMARSKFMPSLPKLENTFPLISVQDLCRIAISVASEDLPKTRPHIFSVTDGEQYTPNRIEAAIYSCLDVGIPRIRVPRWMLYFAAMLAQCADASGIKKNQLGLRLYRNLVDSRSVNVRETAPNYEFVPTATLESEMPNIIRSLKEG